MVRDCVANVVMRLQDCRFNPRKVGHDLWEARCPAHRSANHALAITRDHLNELVLECRSTENCGYNRIIGALGFTNDHVYAETRDSLIVGLRRREVQPARFKGLQAEQSHGLGPSAADGAIVQEAKKNAAPRGRPRGDRDLERGSTAEILMRIAAHGRYFPGDDDRFYAQFAVGDHDETHELRSSSFRRWLIREFHKETRGFVPVEALNNLIATLEADAEDAGPLQNVHLRVGGDLEGAVIYLDLGDPTRRAVAITADGWQIVARPGVTFRRPKGMRPLPEPHCGGSLDVLKKYVNTDDDEFLLLIGWLAAALRPAGPYPIMVLNAEQGSAKSTLARIVRKLVDPHVSPLAGDPREPRDLMVAAQNCWVLALDNISSLPPWLSDYLCRLATGGGLHARTLYSIDLPRLPRMADFAHFGEAVCQGLGHAPGTFLAAYNRNRQAADESALEDSPVARTMKALD